jgi:hypothetical protein
MEPPENLEFFKIFIGGKRKDVKGYLKKESITIIWVCFLL